MNWWYIPVVVLNLYLLAALGPWLVLQLLHWVLQRSGPFLQNETQRLQGLMDSAGMQESIWPQVPRPGRYQQPDQVAREHLAEVTGVIEEIRDVWPTLQAYGPAPVAVGDVLLLRAWGPMLKALVTWRDTRIVRRWLDDGHDSLASLGDQQVYMEEIPHIVRALLNETRADVRRLGAILEAENEAGTVGLEDVERRLTRAGNALDGALDLLDGAADEDMPATVAHVDATLETTNATVAELDSLLERMVAARIRAQNLITRVNSSLDLLDERWAGLGARGATEPAIEEALAITRKDTSHLVGIIAGRTLQAYDAVAQEVADSEGRIQELTSRIDDLDALMDRGREAMEGSVRALADAQTACNHLAHQIDQLEPDMSLALIERAADVYRQAERQRDMGTTEGYQASIALAERARHYLEQAMEGVEPLADTVHLVEGLLDELTEEALADRHQRLEAARAALQVYARHWDNRMEADADEAAAGLCAAEADLERLPPDVRQRQRYLQSELPDSLNILSHARESLEQATDLITTLEEEHARIAALHAEVQEAAMGIKDEAIPELAAVRERMLPELQQRFDVMRQSLLEQIEALGHVEQVDYDRAVSEWLPAALREVEETRRAYTTDLHEYGRMQRDIVGRIDKAWARLARLDPATPPGPDEDIEALANDLDIWRNEIERHAENPHVLRDLLGRRATTLEQRIEGACSQIVEGRRNLDALEKQYRRIVQSARNLRNRLRDLQRSNPWEGITWDSAMADEAWERTIALERESQAALRLVQASNLLQQALHAAQEAESSYSRLYHQVDTALRRLQEESRVIESSLERGRRRADQLRAQGMSAELAALEEYYASAMRIRAVAQNATSVEDALRHLREARDLLNSV